MSAVPIDIPLVCPACGAKGRIHHVITVVEDRLLTRLDKVGCGYDTTYEVCTYNQEQGDNQESVVCYACGREWKNLGEFTEDAYNNQHREQ